MLDEIRLNTGMGLQTASLLIVLPMFCMGVLPLLLLWIGKRLSESALIGAGLGACFSLTLTVALDHLSDHKLAGALTAFVQGIGFIITAAIPYFAGGLQTWTGSFQTVWLLLFISLIIMLAVTTRFNPISYGHVINKKK